MKAQQKNLGNMQKAQKESAKEMDKKVEDQADKQAKSAAKSGFLSIFNKVFTAITAVIGAAMLFVPGLQVAGVIMLAGVAVSIATQIPGVM
ncbi:MAG: type III secretion system translocon subunit SctE, partial [Spartobacteria bacterium]